MTLGLCPDTAVSKLEIPILIALTIPWKTLPDFQLLHRLMFLYEFFLQPLLWPRTEVPLVMDNQSVRPTVWETGSIWLTMHLSLDSLHNIERQNESIFHWLLWIILRLWDKGSRYLDRLKSLNPGAQGTTYQNRSVRPCMDPCSSRLSPRANSWPLAESVY